MGDWSDFLERCDLGTTSWREVLVSVVTYAPNDQFGTLCAILGDRLKERKGSKQAALICYICAGDLNKVVECWMESRETDAGSKVKFAGFISISKVH